MQNEKIKLIVFASLAAAAVIAMSLLAHLTVNGFQRHTIRQTQEHLLTIADAQARHIEDIFHEIESDLEIVALSPAVKMRIRENLPESELPPDEYLPLEDVFRRLKSVASSFYRIDAWGIVQQRVPFKDATEGKDFSQKPGVAYVLANHQPHTSRVFLTESKRRAVSICVPVFDDQQFIGILRGLAYLDALNHLLNHVGDHEETASFIVNQDGEILTRSDNLIEMESIISHRTDAKDDEEAEQETVTRILSGNPGVACFKFDELAYEKSVIAWSPIKMGQKTWSVVTCKDYADISKPIKAHSRNMFILVACFTSTLAGVGLTLHRVNKKKARLEAFIKINRMSEELQHISAERTHTVTELEEQGRLLKNIIAAVHQGVFWKDRAGKYRGCNKNFAVMMGCEKPEQIIGKTDYDIEPDKKQADLYHRYDKEVMKTGIPLLNVQRIRQLPDGAQVNLLTSLLPLQGPSGVTTGVIGIFTHATESNKTGHGPRSKGSNLTGIVSNMDQGVIITDLSGTVIDVNDYYANLAGKNIPQLRGQSIYDSMTGPANKELLALIRKLPKASAPRSVLIYHTIAERDFQIKLQPLCKDGQLNGALINLIDVSELTKARERAEYETYRANRLLASLSHRIRTPMNSIIGFTDLLEKENLTGEQAKFAQMISAGAGNLLEVVNEIVELFNEHPEDLPIDEAAAENDPAANQDSDQPGDTDDNHSKTSPSDSPDTNKAGKDYRVMIVDDVPENRMLIEVLLKKDGYRTASCTNGREAVKLAAEEKFDLILMDIQMPEMDGIEATRTIRSKGPNCRTPVLAMTASVAAEDEMLCLQAGCDDYIRKPINKELLLKKVWRFSQQKEQIKAARQGEEIVSFLSNNPDYHKAIETFVDKLPERIKEMQQAFDEENFEYLNLKVHALKGVGGFAGFPVYSELARSIEHAIEESKIDEIKAKLDEMVNICRRTKLTPH